MTIPDANDSLVYCLTRPGMNPHAEPCRFKIGHRTPHSWDLVFKAEEAALRAKAGKVTLTRDEVLNAIGAAACRIPRELSDDFANAGERPFPGEDPRTPRVE